MRRNFTALAAAVISALLVLTSIHRLEAQQPAPPEPQVINLPGLRERVTIIRDERGIPYIKANSDEDLYFAQGYATANDRLWQLDLLRRTARGELSEIFGSTTLEEDKRRRILGYTQVAEAEVAAASPEWRQLLEAYARGVNAHMDSLDEKSLPPEFKILQYKPRPWVPADSLAVVKLFFETLSNTWRLDLMRETFAGLPPAKRAALLPESSPLDVLVVGSDRKSRNVLFPRFKSNGKPWIDSHQAATLKAIAEDSKRAARSLARLGLHAEDLAASNNWVVSGRHTASGRPLIANDPHLAPSAPPIWYLVHLNAPGIRVAGVTAPGLPGVVIGHNDHIAWGFTNVGPDVQDLYIEKFDPDNPRRYMTPTGWRDAEIRREEIKVRKLLTDTTSETVSIDVTVTRNGPIIFERDGKRYSLRWTALNPKLNNGDLSYLLNRARNWKEFTKALQGFTAPMQNIVYTDVEGNIGYYAAGKVPIRKSGDGSVPYDGSTDAGEWVSYIPFEKLPQVYNPPSGIIVTANQRIVGSEYPYFLTRAWNAPYRARRIMDLLEQTKKISPEDFRKILGDTYSIAGTTFAREAAKVLRDDPEAKGDEKLQQTAAAFEKWDGRLDAESTVAPLIARMRLAFRSKILNSALGEGTKVFGWSNFETTLDWIVRTHPGEWLPPEFKSYAELFRLSYEEGRESLTQTLGTDESKWKWGEMVKARFNHPLAVVPLIGQTFAIPPLPQNGGGGGSGSGASVNVGAPVSMRMIADPGDWDNTQHGITVGQSGIPSSPHWRDQLADWQAVTPRVFPFSDGAITKAAKHTLVIAPR